MIRVVERAVWGDHNGIILRDIAKGRGEGADYFIFKPPQFEMLLKIVRAADEGLSANPKKCEALARFSEPGERG